MKKHLILFAVLAAVWLFGQSSIGGGSFPRLVAKADATAQTADVGSTLLYTVPTGSAMYYRYCAYTVVTTAAGVSSTLPNGGLAWTDNDSNASTSQAGSPKVNLSSGVNAAGTIGGLGSAPASNCIMFLPKPGTAINYLTSGYASSPAAAMNFSLHGRLEALGW